MDGGGRVVIPKDVRSRLGWGPGQEFEISEVDGRVVLETPGRTMHLERRGETVVAAAEGPMPVLTTETVRDVLEHTRR
jgi:AbrB family looped-hinge helix DNA binding protein